VLLVSFSLKSRRLFEEESTLEVHGYNDIIGTDRHAQLELLKRNPRTLVRGKRGAHEPTTQNRWPESYVRQFHRRPLNRKFRADSSIVSEKTILKSKLLSIIG
jgi:hypothetical protein